MSSVKSAISQNENLGMRHYRENYRGISLSRDRKINNERAKSASTYQSLISKKEIEEAGGDYKTLLRLKKKITLGDQQQSFAPYRNSMTMNSNRNLKNYGTVRREQSQSIADDDDLNANTLQAVEEHRR